MYICRCNMISDSKHRKGDSGNGEDDGKHVFPEIGEECE